MALPFKSTQELYDLFISVLLDFASDLTDENDGSIIDGLGGTYSLTATELERYVLLQFNKTYFNLAQGPDENGGGDDDLQILAVDHFGDSFARPQAVKAIDVATFTRPADSYLTYGAVTILAGTVIKTQPDANGKTQRYVTDATVVLTNSGTGAGVTATVGITAVVAGAAGDASAGTINAIETSLLDPTITVSNAGNATGEDAADSPTYREFIRNKILGLAGATLAAIEAAAKTVPGVSVATAIEQQISAIKYDIPTAAIVGQWFYIPMVSLYVADATGTATASLTKAVQAILPGVKAAGAFIQVFGASPQGVNWEGTYTLNPSGPNYSVLNGDNSLILKAMKAYINNLPVGTSFVRADANAAILAIYGPSGTNDLTAFSTVLPTGDVFASPTTKMVAGTISTV